MWAKVTFFCRVREAQGPEQLLMTQHSSHQMAGQEQPQGAAGATGIMTLHRPFPRSPREMDAEKPREEKNRGKGSEELEAGVTRPNLNLLGFLAMWQLCSRLFIHVSLTLSSSDCEGDGFLSC